MFGYRSVEIKKLKANTQELNLSRLRNKEILGLYLIGELSYKEMCKALGLTDQQARDLIEGISFHLSRDVIRDDDGLQVNVWEPTEEEKKEQQ